MKQVFPIAAGILIGLIVISLLSTIMYTYRLAEFFEVDWDYQAHGIAMNGNGIGFGNLINIHDLEAISPGKGGGSVEEWCPDIESERGYITMSLVEDVAVCCDVHETQWLVPFKEMDGYRYYFCGQWPMIDIVRQPLSTVQISVEDMKG